MKTPILVQLVYCVLVARGNDKVLDYKFEKDIEGPYNFRFSTTNGHQREEIAELLHEGTEFESIFLRGSYQYLGADGKTYTVKYRADDNGFHPEGDHFEVPPFVPWPSKIDVRYNEGELKDSGSMTSPSKPFSVNPIKFLTTQRPPKFVYTPIEASAIPSNSFTSTKAPKSKGVFRGRQSKSFKGFSPKDKLIPQEYIPTSTRKPLTKGDVVGSSTAKNSKFSSVPTVTREYIPTSTTPPSVKGDIVGSPQCDEVYIGQTPQQLKKRITQHKLKEV
ncbi:pupal cuticle protein-like [Harmonia axyridis]|uniref:pupal cuticle protein-like n=1 Tax=Harmonia axyridis TaxID=115357 RepID=UPI001E279687|nr:pupal cuticle protein-like [Harmonia axyridis]